MRQWYRLPREAVDTCPWRCSRPSWIEPWAPWSGEWQPCPQQEVGAIWSLPSLLILFILWYFCNSMSRLMPSVSSFPIVFFVVCAGFALASNQTTSSTCSSSLQWDGRTRHKKHKWESSWVKMKIGSLYNTYCCRKKSHKTKRSACGKLIYWWSK